jgi:hypothetical protein
MLGNSLTEYTYRTAEEARAVAADMGLSDVHEVRMKGELMFRPGVDDDELRAALGGGGMLGGGLSLGGGMDDSDDDGGGPFGFM